MTELFPREALNKAVADDDDLTHIVCHDPNRAICGADVSEAPWVPPSSYDNDCLVCLDIEHTSCPECGL